MPSSSTSSTSRSGRSGRSGRSSESVPAVSATSNSVVVVDVPGEPRGLFVGQASLSVAVKHHRVRVTFSAPGTSSG
jgi:hypothetical protein